jgi:hypothetical protein
MSEDCSRMSESEIRKNMVNCVHNSTKRTLGHCKELSEPGCGVGCGASSTDDARERCKFFKEL